MKKCTSELELEAFLKEAAAGGSQATVAALEQMLSRAATADRKPGLFPPLDIGFEFGQRDALIGSGPHQMWAQNLNTTRHPTISTTMESQSSICVGSPNSFNNKPTEKENQMPGGTSGSDSDDESFEMDASDLSGNPVDVKRRRRMESNRESARRSRKRKQAHLVGLESQVDNLRGENSSLFKQLTDASHQFSTACTDNRILKSNVETLRLKVKMAEDMVTRGAVNYGLDRILQAGSPQILTQLNNNNNNNVDNNHGNNNNVGNNNNFNGEQNGFAGLSVAEQNVAGLDATTIWEWDINSNNSMSKHI